MNPALQDDFETLWAHVRAMRTGVWASHADEIWDSVDHIHAEQERLVGQLQAAEEAAQRNWDEHGERMAKAIDAERVGMKALRETNEGLLEQFELLVQFVRDEHEAGLPLPVPIRKIIED